MDRTRLHSQHAFQQVCLLTLTCLLKAHSCRDTSQAAHCRGPSFPPLDRCSPLNSWPHNQRFSSCPVWPLGGWNEHTRAFSVEAALVSKFMAWVKETWNILVHLLQRTCFIHVFTFVFEMQLIIKSLHNFAIAVYVTYVCLSSNRLRMF